LALVCAGRGQMRQVLINPVLNAHDALAGQRLINVRPHRWRRCPGFSRNGPRTYVWLTIQIDVANLEVLPRYGDVLEVSSEPDVVSDAATGFSATGNCCDSAWECGLGLHKNLNL
jgi:hypothetical protein